MAATALVAAATKEAPKVLVHPPASPFAELLRRSKFATYDPAIRQTFSAAPANAHRGDWGLKRPIALRRKKRHPAHFTEWNHAENQVRFIRRIEEMGVRPEVVQGTPWQKSLGKAQTDLLLDSDFCPGESSEIQVKKKKKEEEELPQPTAVDFSSLGNKGRGSYGVHREETKTKEVEEKEKAEVYVTANIDAMSTREFERYLRKLRSLRPQFQEHIRQQTEQDFSNKSLYALAQDSETGFHRHFMMQHMSTEYKDLDARKIEPQPHPNAALTYARPTPLESVLWTKAKPGIILNKHAERTTHGKHQPKYVASFGGLGALIQQTNLGTDKVPLLDIETDEGVRQDHVEQSFADMRLIPRRGLQLQMPPKVVGTKPQGLKGVKILAEVTTQSTESTLRRDNWHPLGSQAYVAAESFGKKSAPSNFSAPKRKTKLDPNFLSRDKDPKLIINTLQSMVSKNKFQGDDQDL
ncbi:hypothetical protein FPV67DRAFT_1462391 [Lyophyllum atratum]|nr:hypothetical protein FPV67DRAFT_1462391 [Lyophyllum atratum]